MRMGFVASSPNRHALTISYHTSKGDSWPERLTARNGATATADPSPSDGISD